MYFMKYQSVLYVRLWKLQLDYDRNYNDVKFIGLVNCAAGTGMPNMMLPD